MKKPTLAMIILFISGPLLRAQSGAADAASGHKAASISWSNFSNSSSMLGVIIPLSKPLQYNDELNTVSFIQRNSASYVPSPAPTANASKSAIVAMISSNWGNSWDSTCLWSDNINQSRYPQGGIYNPAGNTSLSNARAVAMGPANSNNSFGGNWYGSKQLGPGTYNTAVPTDMQYISSSATTAAMGACYFSRTSFSSTDDGVVRSLADYGYRTMPYASSYGSGAMVVSGTYSAGAMSWKSDSLICPAAMTSYGVKSLASSETRMAWNEAGTVGYVVFIGSRTGAIASNLGWQPIIFKTTNSGASWNLLPAIDFNSSGASALKQHLPAVNNSTLVIPYFNLTEGFDLTVDRNDKLHIASLVYSAMKSDIDSVTLYPTFVSSTNGDTYSWPHRPGRRPYLYDFIGDGLDTWHYGIVDSLSSEGPGIASGQPGYNQNPWDVAPYKLTISARIQLSRTPDGHYVVFSWAETDTTTSLGNTQWNIAPNIKTRLLDVNTYLLSDTKIDLTSSSPVLNGLAFMHYASPRSGAAVASVSSVDLKLPVTVSNNVNLHQNETCNHWYASADLSFSQVMHAFTHTIGPAGIATGINNMTEAISLGINVYPNPVKDKLQISFEAGQPSDISLVIQNALGQIVYRTTHLLMTEIDLGHLQSGIYFLKFNTENSQKVVKILKNSLLLY